MYVAMSTFDPATRGVYRVRPDGGSTRLAGTDGILFPNGVALDPRGNVYATDSIGGSVWKISGNAPAQLWAQSPLLAGTGAFGLGFPLGANGIVVRNHAVIVTNTEGASIVRIPIRRDGSAGTPSVLAQGPALSGADGLALDVFGNAFVAVNPQNTLRPSGSSGLHHGACHCSRRPRQSRKRGLRNVADGSEESVHHELRDLLGGADTRASQGIGGCPRAADQVGGSVAPTLRARQAASTPPRATARRDTPATME